MKKRNMVVMALTLMFTMIMSSFTVFAAAPTVEGKYLDNFERAAVDLTDANRTLSDGTVIYWNGHGAGTFAITNGILNAQMNEGGYYRFATNNVDSYKYVIVRIKGDSRAVNDKIYTRIGTAESGALDDNAQRGDKSFAQLKGVDGNPVPAISTSWQDIVIDLQKTGFTLGGGSNGFQIGTWTAMNLDIDYIFMTNTDPNAPVPVKQYDVTVNHVKEDGSAAAGSLTSKVNENESFTAAAKTIDGFTCTGYKLDGASTVTAGTSCALNNVKANHTVTFVYKANPAPVVAPVDPESVINGPIIDNFDRSSLAASNLKLKDGTTIYWNQCGAGTFSISGGILNAKMNDGGYYRLATNNDKSYKYLIIRIKGDSRASNDKIYTRMGAAEKKAIDDGALEKSFAQLVGPDGKAIPKITTSWQYIVIDVSKNGFSFGGGSNAFQIGTWAAMNLDIDFIYMSNTIPNPKTGDSFPTAAAALGAAAAAALVVLLRKKAVR